MERLYDMHCHLDFASNRDQIAKDSIEQNIYAICSTVVPSSFVSASGRFDSNANINVSLGVHPWWIANGRIGEADIDRFTDLCRTTPFIGEIGLDLSDKHKEHAQRQEGIFMRLLDAIGADDFPKLVTLHAVKGTTKVLDLIARMSDMATIKNSTFLFHWFSGSDEELERAIAWNCYFSVGPKMLATEKGRSRAKMIPEDKLLLESDSPAHEGDEWNAALWRQELEKALEDLATLRKCNMEDLTKKIALNSQSLLDSFK